MQQLSINLTSAGAEDKKILDIATGTRVNVYDYEFIASAAVTLTLKDEAGTVFAVYALTANQLEATGPPIFGSFRFIAVGDIILSFSGVATVTGHMTVSYPQG